MCLKHVGNITCEGHRTDIVRKPSNNAGLPDASRRRRSATSSDEVAESCLGSNMVKPPRGTSWNHRCFTNFHHVFSLLSLCPFVSETRCFHRACHMPCHVPCASTSPLLHFSSQNSRWKALGFVQHGPHLTASASRSAWRSVALWLWWVQPLRLLLETPSSQSKMQNLKSTHLDEIWIVYVIHIMYYYVCQCM